MSDQPAAFPPPTIDDAPDSATTPAPPRRLRHPVALFAVAAGLGLLAGIVLGVGVGGFAMAASNSNCTPSDGWCELGGALVGLFAGFLVGAIAYIVAGVTTIVRCRPSGRRHLHVLAHLAFPFMLLIVGSGLGGLGW